MPESEATRRFRAGMCIAQLWHGPGHQSRTFCQVMGPHEIHQAEYHSTGYGQQFAEWEGDEAMTGFFDEAPEVEVGA